jgi:cardiolipin synthase
MRGIDGDLTIADAVRKVFASSLLVKTQSSRRSSRVHGTLHASVIHRWKLILSRLLPLGGASEKNDVTVFTDGSDMFESMWKDIASAEHTVNLSTYTLQPDAIGLHTLRLLKSAARRGVKTTFMYDWWGSSSLVLPAQTHTLRELVAAGVTVIPFNPVLPISAMCVQRRPVRHLLFRNHQKICTIDEQIGYCGGMNIGEQYASKSLGGTGLMLDTHVRVQGAAVHELEHIFYDSVVESNADDDTLQRAQPLSVAVDSPPMYPSQASHASSSLALSAGSGAHTRAVVAASTRAKNGVGRGAADANVRQSTSTFVQLLQSNVWRHRRRIQRALRVTLRLAKHRCYIVNPYFFPPQAVKMAIKAAARRGIDVRLLTAGVSFTDVPVIAYAAQHVYGVLLRAGVRIYELQDRHLHAKTTTIDGIYSSVGSFNMDTFSEACNLEVNLTMLDPEIAGEISCK